MTYLLNAYLSISQKPKLDAGEKDQGPRELALSKVAEQWLPWEQLVFRTRGFLFPKSAASYWRTPNLTPFTKIIIF